MLKRFVYLTTTLMLMLSISGCVAIVEDSITHSMGTGKTYEELSAQQKLQNAEARRIYVYRTAESTKYTIVINSGLERNFAVFGIDDNAYLMLWEVYTYFDLPLVNHTISDVMIVEGTEGFFSDHRFKSGNCKFEIAHDDEKEIFVRIDLIDGKDIPTRVDPRTARTEMMKLNYQEILKPTAPLESVPRT